MRLYLDTKALIDAFERPTIDPEDWRRLFRAAQARDLHLVTSELALAELLVKTYELREAEAAEAWKRTLTSGTALTVSSVDSEVLVEAARLRSELGGHLLDAIHVATARLCDCEAIVSDDRRLRCPEPLEVLRIASLPDRLSSLTDYQQ